MESQKYSRKQLRDASRKSPPFKRKEVPSHVLARSKSVQLMIGGVVLMAFPTLEIYRRLVLGTERRKQTGEILPDGTVRDFSPEEIEYVDKNSFFVKWFGER